ncbi:MAG: threonine-phosphate decarboxylase CobD [Acidobacteriota bacterium]|nr:threonine-phosphate decarboxylase CobD [Acidobacteriota bacterium]
MTHGGNLRQLAQMAGKAENDILDFSANLNPLGPPEWIQEMICAHSGAWTHYPDPDCSALLEAVSERYGVDSKEIIAGNGSSEILYLLARAFGRRGLVPVPSYIDYAGACRASDKPATLFPMEESAEFRLDLQALGSVLDGDEVVFIGQPNNPTGRICSPESIRELARRHDSTLFVLDEAFADFVIGLDRLTRRRPRNVVVLLSLTKSFAIPGLRLGCAVAESTVIDRLRQMQPPWSVNTLAQAVGAAAVKDQEYLDRARGYVARQRSLLTREIESIGDFTVYPGSANFLLIRIDHPGLDASGLARQLLAQGIAIRTCNDFAGLDHRFFRIAVRTEAENLRLCECLRHCSRACCGENRGAVCPGLMKEAHSARTGSDD